MKPLPRLGVFGGGQLGRMLAMAALPLEVACSFYETQADAPAAVLGPTFGDSSDSDAALAAFLASADVFTYEFENIDIALVERIAASKPVYPGIASLRQAQHRLQEKSLFAELAIPTPAWRAVHALSDLEAAARDLGLPLVVKTTTLGYDGKGQYVVRTPADISDCWQTLGAQASLIAESFVSFRRELSIIAVRGKDGETVIYPLSENQHQQGILALSVVPAPALDDAVRRQAEDYIRRLLEHLQHVGALTLELFETADGLLANEMAPRVHNSGHWSIEGADCSQFENHVRAVLGLPLGSTACPRPTAMLNVLGQHPKREQVLAVPGAHLHLYGKSARPGRKLGHITVSADTLAQLQVAIARLRACLPG